MPYLTFDSPIGPLTVFEDAGVLVALEWGKAPDPEGTPLLGEARAQLDAYFTGDLKSFDLPLAPAGTVFQRTLWEALRGIPYGETRTYGEVARALASGPRAVGGACGRNPIPVIVPCHRVLGADGRLTGYSGSGGLDTKRALLRLEGALFD